MAEAFRKKSVIGFCLSGKVEPITDSVGMNGVVRRLAAIRGTVSKQGELKGSVQAVYREARNRSPSVVGRNRFRKFCPAIEKKL
jgi:hypothetical protein